MKPRMLFVDDRSKRIHAALKNYGEEFDVTIAPNVPETLRLLSEGGWDVVSLDFDLDGNDFSDPDSKTCGMEIVRYFEKTMWPTGTQFPRIILHSSNSFACELMYQRLTKRFSHSAHRIIKEPFFKEGEA
jgi:hypothetical protein